ncbi:hypothetical protein N865_09900 [Intrasporangium oryzae NRRL B-24470]|uniref:Phytanoyl-CoA dioxygenase n=2 Tax=Intrasporangium TaxID=53357 RepID=W9G8L5_9MICO|nr:hypothetical protein N865_09900 [Intrasporangium oryzae NRRL B-24470]
MHMFEQALSELDVDRFWEVGYARLPGVYSDEEVKQMREEVHEQTKRGGELATGPLLHVLTDGRMVAVAKKLLGVDRVLYGGDSSATINGVIRAWHKDNTDREDSEAPDWDDRYTQLRFGIYLQDHTQHTGGLNLKLGSHDRCDLSSGETIYVKNEPGDLLVWSMRMTHSGAGTLLKDPTARFPEPKEWNAFPAEQIAPAHDERMAVFVHLGADDKHGRRYLDYLKTRTYMVGAWRKAPFTPEIIQALEAADIVVRDLPAEVRDDKRAGLNANWEPFWYPGMRHPERAGAPTVQGASSAPAPAPSTSGGAKDPYPVDFAKRYARATKRRLNGVLRGARAGWYDSAPKAKKAARAARSGS